MKLGHIKTAALRAVAGAVVRTIPTIRGIAIWTDDFCVTQATAHGDKMERAVHKVLTDNFQGREVS